MASDDNNTVGMEPNNIGNARDGYFDSYEDIAIHRLMLDDRPRTLAYKKGIWENREAFKGAIVMDVGCGTGILSVFCAQAGAKRVHAVEASCVASLAKVVVEDNKLGEVVVVHHSRVEDLQLEDKVDIIVSEWMGFYLLHEAMLDSVLVARDRFLKSGGLIFPESADLWVAPCQLPSFWDYWNDVYGVNMAAIGAFDRGRRQEPAVTDVQSNDILGEESVVKSIDLLSVTQDELQAINFEAVVPAILDGKYQGLCLWFVCNFPSPEGGEYLCLSTRPGEPATHWKQTAIVLPCELEVERGDPIAFKLELRQSDQDKRKYRMEVTCLDPEEVEHPTPCGCNSTKCVIIKKYIEEQGARCGDEEDGEDCLEDE